MKNKVSLKIISLLFLLLSTLPLGLFLSLSSINKLQNDANAVNSLGYIRGSSQRFSHITADEEKQHRINEIEKKFIEIDSSFLPQNKDYLKLSNFTKHYNELKTNWNTLKIQILSNVSQEQLLESKKACWKSADQTTNAATKISEQKYKEMIFGISAIGIFIFILIFSVIFLMYTEVRNKLEIEAIHDPLTNLYNRTHLMDELQGRIKVFERLKQPFSLIFVDIDHFKDINDNCGHLVGDKVLKEFAYIVQEELRDEDKAFRYGGEEFVILAQYNNASQAYKLAERLRMRISEHNFELECPLTISLGISEYHKGDNRDSLLKHADDAMYKAKELGRNQTYVYNP